MVVPEIVREAKGVLLPTAPFKVTTPLVPPLIVSVFALSMVLENVTLAPLPEKVVSKMTFAPKVTTPVIPIAPLCVVMFPPSEIAPVYPTAPVVFTVEL
jgi:hypothetical protein